METEDAAPPICVKLLVHEEEENLTHQNWEKNKPPLVKIICLLDLQENGVFQWNEIGENFQGL